MQRRLWFIGAAELLGGIFVIAGWAMVASTVRLAPAWQAITPVLFGGLSMSAGVLLLRSHRLGVTLSILVQALQLVAVSVESTVRYVSLAGPWIGLVLSNKVSGLQFGGGGRSVAVPWSDSGSLGAPGVFIEAGLRFEINPTASPEVTVAVNLLSVYLLARLVRTRPLRDTSTLSSSPAA